MAQVAPGVAADPEAGYTALGRQTSQALRRQYSSHHYVPADQHCKDEIEAHLKLGFIRKVYGILAAQMLLTVAVCVFCMSNHTIRMLVVGIWGNWVTQLLLFVPLVMVLICMQLAKDKYPTNYILLTIFTMMMALNTGAVCAVYAEVGLGMLVVEAFLLTAVIFVGLSVYTFFSGEDYSWCKAYLFGCLLVLITISFLAIFFPALRNNLIYSLFGAMVFCAYIVYDTFKLTKVYGYDDYIIAAIELYLDIINLFLYILQALAASQK